MESVQKAIRLTFFDQRTARQVMFEHSATADAVLIVGCGARDRSVGHRIRFGSFDLLGILEGVIVGIAGWLFLSFAIWLMGTKLLKGNGDPQTMIRTAGFASLPLLLGRRRVRLASGVHLVCGPFGLGRQGGLWQCAGSRRARPSPSASR